MPVYVVLKKRREEGVHLPFFESFTELPQIDPAHKLLTLEVGECVDVARFQLSDDKTYVIVKEYCVSNIQNHLEEKLTATYLLGRPGK